MLSETMIIMAKSENSEGLVNAPFSGETDGIGVDEDKSCGGFDGLSEGVGVNEG